MRYAELDSIRRYMADIAHYELITEEEEVTLSERIKEGDQSAIDRLATANLRLVIKIALDFQGCGVPLADLIAEGNSGLLVAVERFDPTKGAKFSSYAAWWIKQRIRRVIAYSGKTVRVPVQAMNRFRQIKAAQQELKEKTGREAHVSELAIYLGVSEKSIRKTLHTVGTRTSSMDQKIGEDEDASLGDFIADTLQMHPDELMNKDEVVKILKEVIDDELNERERLILSLRYGLEGEAQPQTLEQVSEIIGRTRERVRQIQYGALKKLKARFSSLNLGNLDTVAGKR